MTIFKHWPESFKFCWVDTFFDDKETIFIIKLSLLWCEKVVSVCCVVVEVVIQTELCQPCRGGCLYSVKGK